MSTRLYFEAPADLSVGRVTVEGDKGVLKEWVATPNQKSFHLDGVSPGYYTAEVAPAGLRPRSYVFEVKSGIINTVTMPPYAVLAAGGGETTFSGVESMQAAVESLRQGRSAKIDVESSSPNSSRIASFENVSVWEPSSFRSSAPTSSRVLSIGLSQDEDPGRIGGWTPYRDGQPGVELEAGVVNLLIAAPIKAPGTHPRLRLSAALEGVRIERMMMPVFFGGTRVTFRASPLITADIGIEVTPRDPERRALLRALQAGVEEEAAAVYDDVLRGGSIERFVDGPEEDAWAAMVAALLTIRFPEVFGPNPPEWGPWLAGRFPWAPDTHIILARHHLTGASSQSDHERAANAALESLRRAQKMGAPYFTAANQLMGEMLGGLAGLKGLGETLTQHAREQLDKWRADVPLQRSAGAIFSWLSADKKLLAKGQAVPFRATGDLADRYARILFRGRVGSSGISIIAMPDALPPKAMPPGTTSSEDAEGSDASFTSTSAAASVFSPPGTPQAPAITLPIIVPDDANKGRFGGQAEVCGHTLLAKFIQTPDARWVDIQLTVRSARTLPPSYSDVAELFLHPTFSPNRLKVPFRGHDASVTVRAVGGFTVGAWLPERGIELECDLALLPDAPTIIRDL